MTTIKDLPKCLLAHMMINYFDPKTIKNCYLTSKLFNVLNEKQKELLLKSFSECTYCHDNYTFDSCDCCHRALCSKCKNLEYVFLDDSHEWLEVEPICNNCEIKGCSSCLLTCFSCQSNHMDCPIVCFKCDYPGQELDECIRCGTINCSANHDLSDEINCIECFANYNYQRYDPFF